jgi:S1-C subfamily serine protease
LLEEMKEASPRGAAPEAPGMRGGERSELGLSVADDPRAGAVVTGVDAGGAAAGLLEPGDVIQEMDGSPVKNARDLADRVRKAPTDRPVLLRVRRDGRSRFVAIERKPS